MGSLRNTGGNPRIAPVACFWLMEKVVSSFKLAQLCNEDPEKANLSVGIQERGLGNPALHRTTPCDAYFEVESTLKPFFG